MKTYNVSNPSDPVTMKADSLNVAAAAVILLGNGAYGADDGEGGSTPVFFGWDNWLEEHDMAELGEWIDDHLAEIATALESVMLGTVDDRADLDAALEAITDDEKRREFIAQRNDRRRSSLNDIETKAHRIAALLREKLETAVAEEARDEQAG